MIRTYKYRAFPPGEGVAAFDDAVAAEIAVIRDLFSEDVWLADGALLKRLFEEKVDATVDAFRRDGWSFVEIRDRDIWKIDGWEELTPRGKRVMTEAETKELTRLRADLARVEAEIGALDEGYCSFDVAEFQAIDNRRQDIADAIFALESPPFTAAQKRKSGVVIVFGHDAIRIRKGLVRPGKGKAAGHGEKTDSGGAENEAPPAMAAWSEATGWLPEPLRAPSYAGPGSNAFAEASAKIGEEP